MPFFYAKNGQNFFYIEINVRTYLIRYDVIHKEIKKEEYRSSPRENKITIADIKKLLREFQNSVCDLLIG